MVEGAFFFSSALLFDNITLFYVLIFSLLARDHYHSILKPRKCLL